MSEPAGRPAPYAGVIAETTRLLSAGLLTLMGWKVRGDWPANPKAVLVAGPHTSNWDGVYMILAAAYFRMKLKWMGKQSLTSGPFGGFVKWLGCVPIDRTQKNDVVRAMSDAFAARDRMVLLIPPEGTRSLAKQWKSGFWHIARMANVPLIVASLDYSTRTVRIDAVLDTTYNYEADLKRVQAIYLEKTPKFPELFGVG